MVDRTQLAASDVARSLGAVLERVMKGETIEIIRYGRVVAVLAPPPKERREPRAVQPDKLGTAAQSLVDAVSPSVARQPVGKISPQERQRKVDQLLKGSRRGD